MNAATDLPMYFLAFDHRGEFARSIFGTDGNTTPAEDAEIAALKEVIFDGLQLAAVSPRLGSGRPGLLVDELYGAAIARAAVGAGTTLAMPVEAPDREVFQFAYGNDFGEHVETFGPTYAKVLVRYNVAGNQSANRTQAERLRRLSEWLKPHGHQLLLELLVPPTPEQLASAGGERRRFEVEQRPHLARAAMAELQSSGIEVAVWKLEGIDDPTEARATVAQARTGLGGADVVCTVLGAGADRERVDRWLRVAAETDGFAGFAIGRSIWRDPLRALQAGELAREAAAAEIAERYLSFAEVYEAAAVTAARSAG